MEDKIDSYKNEALGLSLRVYIDKNNTVWLKGKRVASALGYAKPGNAILAHVDAECKTTFRDILSTFESPPGGLKEYPNSV